ncbi:C45 family autoproteolytic acyltransferase/hydolase [Oceanobacillus sp. CAU 1775]
MQKVFSDVKQFRGSHYDFGYSQGLDLIDSPILKARKRQWKKNSRHFIIDRNKIEPIMKYFHSGIWEELIGLADALEIDMDAAIREFGGYYLEYGKSGCSITAGENYMIRNYDSDPASYEGRYVLYQPTDGGYASIGPSMQITGRTDGMNEKGLSVGYNFVNRLRSDDGFICNMIGRIILEKAATTDEAVELLKEIPHRHSFNYMIHEASGKSVVVEASANEVLFHEGFACTNHFDNLTKENRYRVDESLERYDNIASQQDTIETPYDAYQLMNNEEQGVFSHKYGAWAGTIHTAAYLPHEMQAWISFGNNRLPIIFDFNSWLQGTDVIIKQLKGELSSTNGFINR